MVLGTSFETQMFARYDFNFYVIFMKVFLWYHFLKKSYRKLNFSVDMCSLLKRPWNYNKRSHNPIKFMVISLASKWPQLMPHDFVMWWSYDSVNGSSLATTFIDISVDIYLIDVEVHHFLFHVNLWQVTTWSCDFVVGCPISKISKANNMLSMIAIALLE